MEKYKLTRIGYIVARCIEQPFDTSLRDEIERVVYSVANRNPRPIILEIDIPELVSLLMECVETIQCIERLTARQVDEKN